MVEFYENNKKTLGSVEQSLVPLYLKLPTEHIAALKFILESYEGLAIERTLDADRGYVVVLALTETLAVVEELLQSLGDELELRIIPEPTEVLETFRGDWLFEEFDFGV